MFHTGPQVDSAYIWVLLIFLVAFLIEHIKLLLTGISKEQKECLMLEFRTPGFYFEFLDLDSKMWMDRIA